MKRHAYLIIAHQHFDMLERLVRALDSGEAGFYVHIDCRARGFDEARLRRAMKNPDNLHVYRKYKISWGADTQVRCEMLLLEQAVRGGYDNYHLLSGVDIPLRRREEIEAFFEEHTESFVQILEEADNANTLDRVRYRYPFQNRIGRPRTDGGFWYGVLQQLSYECVKLQRALGMDRTKKAPFSYCRGGNWFSIRHELAAYVVAHRRDVARFFYHSLTADEMFLQCLACASPYRDSLVHDNLRLIDWSRTEHDGCSPHTFTMDDWDMLTTSDRLWARKFDPAVDAAVIDALYARCMRASNKFIDNSAKSAYNSM